MTRRTVYRVEDFSDAVLGALSQTGLIQAAMDSATQDGGGMVFTGPGGWSLGGSLNPRSNVWLCGAGRNSTTLKARPTITTAVLAGLQSASVTDFTISDLTIDGDGQSGNGSDVVGAQFSGGLRIRVRGVRFVNTHDVACYLNGCTDSSVTDCDVINCGVGGTRRHGIFFGGGSTRCVARGNFVSTCGGMLIRIDAVGGASTDCSIVGNQLVQGPALLECIGVTANCVRTKIRGNTCLNGGDNGISCSANECSIVGNTATGSRFHGIQIGGSNTVVLANVCKNNNQAGGATRAGIGFDSAGLTTTDCIVVGNRCFDDQGTPTQDFGLKGAAADVNNVIAGNDFRGNGTAGVGGGIIPASNTMEANLGFVTEARGRSTQTPGAVTVVTIPHGLGAAPSSATVTPGDANSRGAASFYATMDATNITLTFSVALAAATQYVWNWAAEV